MWVDQVKKVSSIADIIIDMKNKTYYNLDYVNRFHNARSITVTKWQLIKRFISFLINPEELQIQISKINNIVISQNQIWEYNKEKEEFVLETDLRGEKRDLWQKDKYIK